ncbi:MAG: aspartyl-tRNA(Asn)/glutamyl-tRNA (Gln) amidotransferase subunit A [Parcubacteria group bacterium Gr01-1014_17]|nr:MAG: aspartyl-tRNA(Asn)/glutamyl-tRNA (Gln) amidotransferase subunit A [Parcubacteria group bacterium Gr01-1014_17]
MIDLKNLTIKKAHGHLTKGDFSALELAEAYLKNIEAKNKELNAYLEVFNDVREQAKEADKRIKAGKAEVLTGIPLAIKDNILIQGRRVGAASKILDGYVAPYDATAIKKLKDKGAVFLGRTNCDEFAMGGSTENSAYGVTKNPHDTSRVTGGSSGGSAAAVAADLALAALGSDTGGSVRQPASFCGVVGFKSTYGAVSRNGLIAMGSSLDCVGPIAKTTEDAEIIFDCICGKDALDSTSIELSTINLQRSIKELKIGVPRNFIETEGIDAEVLKDFNESLLRLKKAGAKIVDVDLPSLQYALACYYIIMPAEASTNLARFDGVKYGPRISGTNGINDYFKTRALFGPEVRRRILLGTYVLSAGYYDAYYGKALAARSRIRMDFENVFNKVGIIAVPTSPTPAWKIGEKTDPLSMYLADIFTVTANIAGIPAISVPSGKTKAGLPLGLQLMAPVGGDEKLFNVCKSIF